MSRLHKSLKVLSFFMTSLVLGLPALSAAELQGETIDVVLFEEAVQGPVFVISLPEDVYSDPEWKAKRGLFVKHLSVELSSILQRFSLASVASEVEAVALPVEMRREHLDSKGKTADVIRIVLPLVSASAEEYQDAVYDMWHLLEKVVNTFIVGLPDMDYAKIKADLDKQEAEAENSEEEATEKDTEEATSVSDGEAGESSQTEGAEKVEEEGEAETESSEESNDLEEASDESHEAQSDEAEVEVQDVPAEVSSSSEEESGAEEETEVLQGVPVEMSDTAEETEEKTEGVSEEQDGDQEEESGCSRGTSETSKEQMEESEESSSGEQAHEVLEVEKSNYGAGGI